MQRTTDANYDGMRRALLEFNHKARASEMAVVFFAGHGIEVGGENWLIPIDAELKTDTDTEHEAIALKTVLGTVDGATKLGLVILDACRNNPFDAKMQRSVRTRAVSRGLAQVEPIGNVLVAFAAKDGTTALDGSGRNSPFTAALLKNLETPGLEINFLFRRVRDDVLNATKREQQPFVYGSLSQEELYFKPAQTGKSNASALANAPENVTLVPKTANPIESGQTAFDRAKAAGTPQAWDAFLNLFGNGPLAARAREERRKFAAIPPELSSPLSPPTPQVRGAERAVLYEEDANDPAGKQFIGSAKWSTERAITSDSGQATEITVRAEIDIPDRQLKVAWTLRRNTDRALPASHTVEVKFTHPADFAHGAVNNVPGLLMKQTEEARGVPLTGAAVKVTGELFILGLSAIRVDRPQNVQLIKDYPWFDVPIVYTDGKRAILAVEKGPTGAKAMAEGFAEWDKSEVSGQDSPKSERNLPIDLQPSQLGVRPSDRRR